MAVSLHAYDPDDELQADTFDPDPDGGGWFPGPPWRDRLMLAGLILFAYQGTR